MQFRFEDQDLQVLIAGDEEAPNAFVGGKNRWAYNAFTNWTIFSLGSFPVLVYFRETQTKPEGQIHFFPVIFDVETLEKTMTERCGGPRNWGAKE